MDNIQNVGQIEVEWSEVILIVYCIIWVECD